MVNKIRKKQDKKVVSNFKTKIIKKIIPQKKEVKEVKVKESEKVKGKLSKLSVEKSKDDSSKEDKSEETNTKQDSLPTFKKSPFSKIKQNYETPNPFIKKKIIKHKISKYTRLKNLKNYLEKAGFTVYDETIISKNIIKIAVIINFIFTIYLFYTAYFRSEKLVTLIPTLFAVWSIVFLLTISILWVLFYVIVDLKIFRRKLALEEVLPDFLFLTSANINAGMPIDQALWFAVRPRFGILAKEIEEVAKRTLVGDDLKDGLIAFTRKYDSVLLKRSINLLLEGIDSGGRIADIINKIALDIQNTRTFKKEMAANVTTYVIFISFATVAAAPVLFALSKQLLIIIMSIMGNINMDNSGSGPGLTFDASAISLSDFNIFAMVTLAMTSIFSAMIISIIKKGNIKEGLNYIPMFIGTSLVIYLIASKVLGIFLGGMF